MALNKLDSLESRAFRDFSRALCKDFQADRNYDLKGGYIQSNTYQSTNQGMVMAEVSFTRHRTHVNQSRRDN